MGYILENTHPQKQYQPRSFGWNICKWFREKEGDVKEKEENTKNWEEIEV